MVDIKAVVEVTKVKVVDTVAAVVDTAGVHQVSAVLINRLSICSAILITKCLVTFPLTKP